MLDYSKPIKFVNNSVYVIEWAIKSPDDQFVWAKYKNQQQPATYVGKDVFERQHANYEPPKEYFVNYYGAYNKNTFGTVWDTQDKSIIAKAGTCNAQLLKITKDGDKWSIEEVK